GPQGQDSSELFAVNEGYEKMIMWPVSLFSPTHTHDVKKLSIKCCCMRGLFNTDAPRLLLLLEKESLRMKRKVFFSGKIPVLLASNGACEMMVKISPFRRRQKELFEQHRLSAFDNFKDHASG